MIETNMIETKTDMRLAWGIFFLELGLFLGFEIVYLFDKGLSLQTTSELEIITWILFVHLTGLYFLIKNIDKVADFLY